MKKFRTKYYRLRIKKENFPEKSVRLAFISDVHNSVFGNNHCLLLQTLERLKVDAVLVGGDVVVAKPGMPLKPAVSLVRQLSERFPLYYALGNHEYRLKIYPDVYGNAYQEYRESLKEYPIKWLENACVNTMICDIPFQIFGLELERCYFRRFRHPELDTQVIQNHLGKPDSRAYSILMAHHPGYAQTYFDWGADLTLSGHFHGGVMRLGNRGVISPDIRLFPRYCYGLYKKDHKRMIVSGGIGEHTIPFRIFNPRELVVIDLDFNRKGHEALWEYR